MQTLVTLPDGRTDSVPVMAIGQPSGSAGSSGSSLLVSNSLARPLVARQLAAGATSVNTVLTTTTVRASLFASGCDIRYAVGTVTQTASATSHFIGQGERLDIAVPAGANIGVIRAGATSGVLEVSELS